MRKGKVDSILGRTILGYQVKEKIGTGGFGDVYRVERTNIVGKVNRALKVITLPKDNQYLEILNSMGGDYDKTEEYLKNELDRVVDEIRVMSMIAEKDNTHIVSYFENDIEKTDKNKYNIYILMELMTPLDRWLYENNITVEQAIDVSLGVAKGIRICHENNIVHRDVKLNNVFVSKDGKFKLGDFGIARKFDALTLSHTIKGTPRYIAPEIYVKNEKYSTLSDIYSLGILMYYLFNKRRYPFYPNYPEVYKKDDEDRAFYERMQYRKMPDPICAPQKVAEIILKTLEKPEKRYGDINELISDLEKVKKSLSEGELRENIGFDSNAAEIKTESQNKEKQFIEALGNDNSKSISFFEHSVEKKAVSKKKHFAKHRIEEETAFERKSSFEHNDEEKTASERKNFFEQNVEKENISERKNFWGNNTENKTKRRTKIALIIGACLMTVAVSIFVAGKNKEPSKGVGNETTTYDTTKVVETTNVEPTTTQVRLVTVGSFKNKKYSKAVSKIKNSGLKIKKKSFYNESVSSGTIISQSIAAGTKVVEGTTIVLNVSRGPKNKTTETTRGQKAVNTVPGTTHSQKSIKTTPETTARKKVQTTTAPKSQNKKDQFNFGEIVE